MKAATPSQTVRSKLGVILSEGTGGEVFHDESDFFYTAVVMDMGENDLDDAHIIHSDKFASLESLLASLPPGVRFQRS